MNEIVLNEVTLKEEDGNVVFTHNESKASCKVPVKEWKDAWKRLKNVDFEKSEIFSFKDGDTLLEVETSLVYSDNNSRMKVEVTLLPLLYDDVYKQLMELENKITES